MSPSPDGKYLHYKLVEKLGEGGMGVVYKAFDSHLERHVAIKLLPQDKMSDPERQARFAAEAKAASALLHPNIITIHDIASDNGREFIVMEYVAGKTLEELIGRKGLRLKEALRYAIQIADALARAHGAGIIHRDIKPSNVIVDEHGHVKVLDFGLAKLTEVAPSGDDHTRTLRVLTEEGTVLGTAAYMSPEQAEGKTLDSRSDIFSFGVMLYEMLTGRRPFSGDSKVSVLSAVLHADPSPLGEDVPAEVQRLVLRCLRKDPARRWQTMADLKVALEEIRDDSESGRLSASTQSPRRDRAVWLIPAMVCAVLAVVAAAAILYGRRKPADSAEPYAAVPLTTYPGQQYAPTFSPDGSQVAFTWCRAAGCAIYVKQIGVEEPYRLSAAPDNAHSPQWSPDGAYIAFQRRVDGPEPRLQYVVMPQRGGAERIAADLPRPLPLGRFPRIRCLSWSADSKALIVEGAETIEEQSRFYEVSFTGGVRRTILQGTPREALTEPSVSPTGSWLAYRLIRSDVEYDLYVVRLANGSVSGAPLRIAGAESAVTSLTWARATDELFFAAGSQLWRWRPDSGASAVRVQTRSEVVHSLALSARGQLAYAARGTGDRDIYRLTKGPGGLWSRPERFISSTRSDLEPQFSPDGKRVALSSARSGSHQIWVYNSDGSNPISLTPDGPPEAQRPRWSPDGRSIVFYARGAGHDIFVVDALGGTPRRLTDDAAADQNPEWSCDSKFVYFNSNRGVGALKVPVSGGTPKPIGRPAVTLETSDCKYLITATGWPDRYILSRFPLSGGNGEVIAEGIHPTSGFAIFADGVFYVGKTESDGKFPILFRGADGAARELTRIEDPFWGFTVSPDRQTILYASGGSGDINLSMVEHFK